LKKIKITQINRFMKDGSGNLLCSNGIKIAVVQPNAAANESGKTGVCSKKL
jgi:hypothetical protein